MSWREASRLKHVLRGFAVLFSVLVVAMIGLVLSAPLWINEAAVKSEIAGQIARATGDSVELDRLQLHYLPLPSVVVSSLKFSRPGLASLRAESAAVSLDLWALLSGRVQPRVVNLSGAHITIRVPFDGQGTQPGIAPPSLEVADRRLRELVRQVTTALPNLQATIEDDRVDVLFGDRPPLLLQAVGARVRVLAESMEGEITCSSNLWEKLFLSFGLSGMDLGGAGHAEVIGLQTSRLNALLGLAAESPSADAAIIGRIDWRMQGLGNLTADLIASSPQVTLMRGTNWHALEDVSIAAGFQSRGRALEASVHRLYLGSPHLMLSANLARNESGIYTLEGDATGVDLNALLAAARDIAPEMPWFARPPFAIRGGTIAVLRIGSDADSPSELLRPDRLRLEAVLEGVGIDLADKGVQIRDIGSRFSFERGELRVQSLAARVGKSVLLNARLATDLMTEPLTLDAEAELAVDLAESLVLARQILPEAELRSRLDDLEQIEGNAVVRLALKGGMKAPLLRADISEMKFIARHRAVPLPIKVSTGRAAYTGETVSLNAVNGHIGESSFTGLAASLGVRPPYRFSVSHERATLSLAELLPLAAAVPELGRTLGPVKRVSGTIELSGSQARGSLQTPDDLLYLISATPRSLVVFAPDIGPELTLDGGAVELSRLEIDIKNIGVAVKDAAISVSAHAVDYRRRWIDLHATANGKLGADALAWIYHAAKVPAALQMRAPIEVADADVTLRDLDDLTFKGRFSIADKAVIAIEGRRSRNTVEIGRVTVKDARSDASFGGKLANGNAEGWFKGLLVGETLTHAFDKPAFAIGDLRGDLSVKMNLARIKDATARGHLQGSAISVGQGLPIPLEVEKFMLEADSGKVVIRQAEVSSGESRIALTGSIERRDNKFVVDADLRSERIVLPELPMAAETTDKRPSDAFDLSKLPVEGRIGVKVQSLEFGRFTIAPLIAGATLAPAKFDLDLDEAAICGVNLAGGLTGEKADIRVHASLKSRDAELDRAITCLTGEHLQASGRIDLDAQFTTQGTLDTVRKNLRGTFSVTARNGNIKKLDALNKIFGVLNLTEELRGKDLEISAAGLPYRTMSARGALDRELIHFEEAVLDAPTVNIVAAGNIAIDTENLAVDVLVAPLQTVNYVTEHVPFLTKIFGGAALAVPVRVTGTLKNPIVVPLGPGAVARRFTEVIGNVLKLPVDAIRIVTPGAASKGESPAGKDQK